MFSIISVGLGFFLTSPAISGEKIPQVQVNLSQEMTLQEAAQANQVSLETIGAALHINAEAMSQRKLGEVLGQEQLSTVSQSLEKLIIEKKLEENKNWPVVFAKLGLWALLILGSGFLLARGKTSTPLRLTILAVVVLVLGFVLGSDPNPLGMIKDALYIYGTTGVVFKPRIIVGAAILLTVAVGGRLYCGWGCHLGALQDLLYHTRLPKFRIHFGISNLFRFLALAGIAVAALAYGLDILDPVDPYKMFNFDLSQGILISAGLILVLSLFTYRPWCTLVCPFGFLAWAVEKLSFLKINYRPDLCKNCRACADSCPTGRAASKLAGQQSGECYSCGQCLDACKFGAVSYGRKK
ncbi:MAG TPA: 4Fe-4S binding protein [Bacillota bacterium]|nr:4Fe-4S binding protein [Bacillota bacterium]